MASNPSLNQGVITHLRQFTSIVLESTGKYVTGNLLLIKTPLSIKRLEEHWDYFHILGWLRFQKGNHTTYFKEDRQDNGKAEMGQSTKTMADKTHTEK